MSPRAADLRGGDVTGNVGVEAASVAVAVRGDSSSDGSETGRSGATVDSTKEELAAARGTAALGDGADRAELASTNPCSAFVDIEAG